MGNITIKSVWQATVNEIIRDLTHWEDSDTIILVMATETGRIQVTWYDGGATFEGNTIKEALIRMGAYSKWRTRQDPHKAALDDELDLVDGEHLVLDWRDAKLPIQMS